MSMVITQASVLVPSAAFSLQILVILILVASTSGNLQFCGLAMVKVSEYSSAMFPFWNPPKTTTSEMPCHLTRHDVTTVMPGPLFDLK